MIAVGTKAGRLKLVVQTRPQAQLLFRSSAADAGQWLLTHSSVQAAESGEVRADVQAHRAAINCVAIAPDGELVATGSAEGSARLWFAQSGAEAGWLRSHDGCGGCVCCERTAPPPMWPGSQPAAGAALDDAPRALSPLCERVGHWAAVSAAAFEEQPRGALATDRPGGADSAARRRRLATGGRDGVVVLWDARAAAPEQLLDCEGGEVPPPPPYCCPYPCPYCTLS